ncbi:M24 family metallopeptidase [Streptomyces sp. NPDC002680]|uniref:M24 family metallopeptidase n=1 Tax=Streptomyces sp. NPDC002680 TaxID=3364659 RepID=UPI0036BBA53C
MYDIGSSVRFDAVRRRMCERQVDALVLAPKSDLAWLLPGVDVLYTDRPCMLFVSRHRAAMVMPGFEVPEFASQVSGIEMFGWNDREGPEAAVAGALASLEVGDGPVVAADDDLPFRYLKHLLPLLGAQPRSGSDVIGPLRLVKDKEEIEALQVAADLVSDAVDHAIEVAQIGMTERELQGEISAFLRLRGSGSADYMVVAFGPNAAQPHHVADDTVLAGGSAVLFDIGVEYRGFWADMTQQVHFGQPSEEYARAYAAVQEAQDAAFAAAVVGHDIGALCRASNEALVRNGYRENTRVGHGIGLDVHEAPSLVPDAAAPLEAGLVVTLEPGVYLPGRFGIRIEDMVVAGQDGPRRLTRAPRPIAVKHA